MNYFKLLLNRYYKDTKRTLSENYSQTQWWIFIT